MKHPLKLLLFFCVIANMVNAQLPQTQVFYLPMKYNKKKGIFKFGELQRISKKKGYNNQPSFTPDNKSILYITFMDSTNTDIVSYNIKRKSLTQITSTPENEYSPVVTPDGKYISCVRGEAQQLWEYNLDGGGKPKQVIKNFDSIGYYCWLNPSTIVTNVLPEPFTLYAHSLDNDTNIAFALGIGRSLQALKNENTAFYIQKRDSVRWYINALQLNASDPPQFYTVGRTLEGEEDFAIMDDGTILMFTGKQLYKWNIVSDRNWKFVYDFESAPVDGFYRISVAPNQKALAIVGYKGKKP
jgi:hypothetical protein